MLTELSISHSATSSYILYCSAIPVRYHAWACTNACCWIHDHFSRIAVLVPVSTTYMYIHILDLYTMSVLALKRRRTLHTRGVVGRGVRERSRL